MSTPSEKLDFLTCCDVGQATPSFRYETRTASSIFRSQGGFEDSTTLFGKVSNSGARSKSVNTSTGTRTYGSSDSFTGSAVVTYGSTISLSGAASVEVDDVGARSSSYSEDNYNDLDDGSYSYGLVYSGASSDTALDPNIKTVVAAGVQTITEDGETETTNTSRSFNFGSYNRTTESNSVESYSSSDGGGGYDSFNVSQTVTLSDELNDSSMYNQTLGAITGSAWQSSTVSGGEWNRRANSNGFNITGARFGFESSAPNDDDFLHIKYEIYSSLDGVESSLSTGELEITDTANNSTWVEMPAKPYESPDTSIISDTSYNVRILRYRTYHSAPWVIVNQPI